MTDLKSTIQTGLEHIRGQVKESFDTLKGEQAVLKEQVIELSQRSPGAVLSQKTMSPMDEVVKHDNLTALRERRAKSAVIPCTAGIDALCKSIVGDAGSSSDTTYPLPAQRYGGMGEDARRSLRLLDVIPRIAVSAGKYEFVQLNSFTNDADYQLEEGALKAEQSTEFDLATANLATIAVTQPASEQVLADSPSLSRFLQSKLVYGVLEKFEREVIGGTGAAGEINGLIAQASTFTASSDAVAADAIGEAMAYLESLGYEPGIILMSPQDWQAIRSERTTGDGQYVAGGWNMPAPANVWGVPVVTSAAMTQGTALVLDPRELAILDRMSARFELGYVDAGFAENIITCRAELRGGLAVFSPSSLASVSLV